MSEPLIETITRKYMKGPHKAVRPVDASSIILMDMSAAQPRVLMGKRNPAAKFMPGVFVFPGGRVEKGDGDVPHAGSLSADDMRRLGQFVTRPTLRRLRGLALGAIRETFEETGLRISTPATAPVAPQSDSSWAAFLATGELPNLDGLMFLARAITPPGRPRRFDTRFFAIDVSSITDVSTVKPTPESELVELRWVTLDEAMTLDVVEITQIILEALRRVMAANLAPEAARPFFRARHRKFERIAL